MVILAHAFPGRNVLDRQASGQCVSCLAKVWRVLLDGSKPGEHRSWVAVEPQYWALIHECIGRTKAAA